MTAALEGCEWSAARPSRTLPPGKTRYPFHRRLSGPQGRSGRAENLVPTGIRSRTVKPVAQSLYRLSYPASLFLLLCNMLIINGRIICWHVTVLAICLKVGGLCCNTRPSALFRAVGGGKLVRKTAI